MKLKNKVLSGLSVGIFMFLGLMLLSGGKVEAANTCTASTGNWSATGTWSGCGGVVPTSADAVIIPTGITLTVDTSSAVAATVTLQDPVASSNALTLASSGVLLVNGAFTIAGSSGAGNSTVTIADSGTLLSVGSFSIVGGSSTGNSVITTGLGAITTAGGIAFSGTQARAQLTITGAGTFNLAGGAISSGGTLSINSATGLFSTGTSAINGSYTFGQGTVTSGTLTIGGSVIIPTLVVSGSLVNNGTLTVSTSLSGAGTLTQGVSSVLNIGNTDTMTASHLTASASGNTVNYTKAGAQTVYPAAYYNLTLSGSGVKTVTGVTTTGAYTVVMGGHNYTVVSGSTATSIDNTSPTLVVVVPSGTFTLHSGDSFLLPDSASDAQTCNPTNFYNSVTLAPGTVTVTPTTTATCFVNGGGGGQLNMTSSSTVTTPVVGNTAPSSSSTTTSNTSSSNSSSTSTTPAVQTATPVVIAAPVMIEGCGTGTLFSAVTGQSCAGAMTTTTPVVATYSFTTTISKTSSKALIMDVQNALNAALGVNLKAQLAIDGKWGAHTTAAVKLFQKMNNITTTGMVGPKTGAAFNALNIPMSK